MRAALWLGQGERRLVTDLLLPRDLGDGLRLRTATANDIERQVALTSTVFRDGVGGTPSPEAAPWARDLGSGRHPLSSADRCVFVEDTRTKTMVACVWLIPMRWTLGGISVPVGRPEHVATHPDYRRRGLIREIFQQIHLRSEADGDLAQAITGIPYYYRQFGYEYALELGGRRLIKFDDIPGHDQGTIEPFTLRDACDEDLPFLRKSFRRQHEPYLVANDFTEAYWQWMTQGINHESGLGWRPLMLIDRTGVVCGSVLLRSRRWGDAVSVLSLAVNDDVSLADACLPMLRAIRDLGASIPPLVGRGTEIPRAISLGLGSSHPIYDVLDHDVAPRYDEPAAWLIRVSDLPRFLRRVAPVIEHRIVTSAFHGFTRTLHFDFYRGGLMLAFESGRLVAAQDWNAGRSSVKPDAGFPPGVFLQLVFGRRTLAELRHILPDVWATERTESILRVLFPRQASHVLPVS